MSPRVLVEQFAPAREVERLVVELDRQEVGRLRRAASHRREPVADLPGAVADPIVAAVTEQGQGVAADGPGYSPTRAARRRGCG